MIAGFLVLICELLLKVDEELEVLGNYKHKLKHNWLVNRKCEFLDLRDLRTRKPFIVHCRSGGAVNFSGQAVVKRSLNVTVSLLCQFDSSITRYCMHDVE